MLQNERHRIRNTRFGFGTHFTNPYVNPYETTCNNIIETLQILGIEAARQTLLNEIQMVIEFDGSYVNYRHLSLLIDTITYKGQLMSITRHGMNRTETGVLMRCSFEETVNIIIDSACCAQRDNLSGVTESIVMGQLPKIGTGIVDILMDFDKLNELNNEPEPILYCPPSPSRKDIQYIDSFFLLKEKLLNQEKMETLINNINGHVKQIIEKQVMDYFSQYGQNQ